MTDGTKHSRESSDAEVAEFKPSGSSPRLPPLSLRDCLLCISGVSGDISVGEEDVMVAESPHVMDDTAEISSCNEIFLDDTSCILCGVESSRERLLLRLGRRWRSPSSWLFPSRRTLLLPMLVLLLLRGDDSDSSVGVAIEKDSEAEGTWRLRRPWP